MSKHRSPLSILATDPIQLSLFSLKSKMIIIITEILRKEHLSQTQAAKKLAVSQPRISNLIQGQMDKFSIDMLIELLGKLGYLIEITFKPNDEIPIKIDVKKATV